jgi:hypothetical protein
VPIPTISAPVSLLTNPALSASAKVVWLASRLSTERDMSNISTLTRMTGLARMTVIRGIARLTANGWQEKPQAGHSARLLPLQDHHRIAEAEEPVPLPDRLLIGGQGPLPPQES